MEPVIYLDYNATYPVWPEAVQAMEPYWREHFGNPSSLHQTGKAAARKLREARQEVAGLLDTKDETEIVFTSGGTESNNTVFRSALHTQKGRNRIVTTSVEHSSIRNLIKELGAEGAEIIVIPVDTKGHLDLQRLREALTEDTALVSVMTANNETGVLFPLDMISAEVRSKGILLHTDAVQAVGKIPISVSRTPVDFLSISGHKFGAPKGTGALYIKKGSPFRPLIFGGVHERGRRAGTENVPGIVGLGQASRKIQGILSEEGRKLCGLRDWFEEEVLREVDGVEINGDPKNRLPNTSNLTFEGVDAEAFLILLDEAGVSASSGSACLSGAPEPSPVLRAMGFSDEQARSSVRFSFGPGNTKGEIHRVVNLLKTLTARLRESEFSEQHPHE